MKQTNNLQLYSFHKLDSNDCVYTTFDPSTGVKESHQTSITAFYDLLKTFTRTRTGDKPMSNIYSDPYSETPEQRLRNSLINRKTTRSQTDKPRLSPAQKRKLQTLDVDDKLTYLRNLDQRNGVSNAS